MDSKNLAYAGFGVAVLAIVTGVFGWFPAEIVWGVAGFFGFGGIGALRNFIDSEGWKTYAAIIPPMVSGVLMLFNVIDLVTYQLLIAAFVPVTGATVTQGVVKAQT